MKEYKAQMLYQGKWVTAHKPGGPLNRPRTDRQDVEDFIARCDQAWIHSQSIFDAMDCIPAGYRIIVREVTDWEAEESV